MVSQALILFSSIVIALVFASTVEVAGGVILNKLALPVW